MSPKVRWLITATSIAVIVASILSVYAYTAFNTVTEDPAPPNVTAKYVPSLLSRPGFVVHVFNESGQPVITCLSVYGLMPNGSIGLIDFKCGRGGSVNLNYTVIRDFAKSWRDSLRAMGNDPDIAEPGLIMLGVVIYSNGIRSFIRGMPINTTLITRGYSVDVNIRLNTTALPMIPRSELMKLTSGASVSLGAYAPVTMQTWPPSEILSSCATDPYTGIVSCYIWRLDHVFYSATFTGIPTAMLYVTGNVYKVNDVALHEHIEARESSGIYVNFAGGAEVDVKSGSSVSTSYEADIYTFTLRKSYVYLDYYMIVYPDLSPINDKSFISAVGFIGNYTIARYKLYYCISPSVPPYCYYVDENATMAIAAPILRNNAMIRWSYNDTNPSDGYGLDPIFNVVAKNWKSSSTTTSTTGVWYYSYNMVREVNGIDLLAAAIPLLKSVPVSPYIAASVGLSSENQQLTITEVYLSLKSSYVGSGIIYAKYYYTPIKYQWGGSGNYYIPATYIYASIS